MKNYLIFFILLFGGAINSFAQSPGRIPFQGILRNSDLVILKNQQVSFRFTIHNLTSAGTIIFQETQIANSNSLGIISIEIGNGTLITGSLTAANWRSDAKFLQVEIDTSAGNSYIDYGTSQLMAVPYALFADSSGFAKNGLPAGISEGNSLRWNGSNWVVDSFLTVKGSSVSAGNTNPEHSAILELKSSSKGLLIPRMTTAQRDLIYSPATGLQIFNLDDSCSDIFNGWQWIKNCPLFAPVEYLNITDSTWQCQPKGFGSDPCDYNASRATYSAVSFTINGKGYICTGYSASIPISDLWEYDPILDIWTQKAFLSGLARYEAVGFALNNKGYVGTGLNGGNDLSDFHEYNPLTNSWTAKNNFPGPARHGAVSFTINNKGYVCTGISGNGVLKDLWEYNPVNDTWIQMIDLPGARRGNATSFSSGNCGYITMGQFTTLLRDLWEFNASNNTWVQKQTFPDNGNSFNQGFAINNKGYVGGSDYWQYDIASDSWSFIDPAVNPYYLSDPCVSNTPSNIVDPIRKGSVFTINDEAYLVGGVNLQTGLISPKVYRFKREHTNDDLQLAIHSSLDQVAIIEDNWSSFDSTLYTLQYSKVGIGTASPASTLTVNGSMNVADRFGVGESQPQRAMEVNGNAVIGNGYAGNIIAPPNSLLIEGSVSVSVLNPVNKLTINNTMLIGQYTSGIFNNHDAGVSGKTGFGLINPVNNLDVKSGTVVGSVYAGSVVAPVDGIIIEGKVGIGTSQVVNQLDVAGGIAIGTNYSGTNVAPANGLIVEGKVGIGTSTPTNTLDIKGGSAIGAGYAGVNTAPSNGLLVQGNVGLGTSTTINNLDVSGGCVIGSGYSGLNTAPVNGLLVEGNVSIGTTTSANKLTVAGTVKLGANGTTINQMMRVFPSTASVNIPANTTTPQTYTISNGLPGSTVIVSPGFALNAGIIIAYARLISSTVLEISYRNTTSSSINLTAGIPLAVTIIQ